MVTKRENNIVISHRNNAIPRPGLSEVISLCLTKLARLRCRSLTPTDDDSYDDFYEEFFLSKDLDGRFFDARRQVRNETLLEYLNQHVPAGSAILDVGCGVGEVLDALPSSYRLSGLEYAQSNVFHASKLLGDKAGVRQGSIYEMGFDAASQDVCFCLEVLEHIEDDARAVREIARVLRPGGTLIASVPYAYYWPQYKALIGHFRHYTRESFGRLLDENGLVVAEHLRNYPNWHLAYARRYCWVRFLSLTFGGWRKGSVYTFQWPWSKKRAIEKVAHELETLKEADAQLNYASLHTSTFVAARKPKS